MKIPRLIAASILLLGFGIMTGLRTKAQTNNVTSGIENQATNLTVINRPDVSLEQANLALDTAISKSIELGGQDGYRRGRCGRKSQSLCTYG